MRIAVLYAVMTTSFAIGVAAAYFAYRPLFPLATEFSIPNTFTGGPPSATEFRGAVVSTSATGTVVVRVPDRYTDSTDLLAVADQSDARTLSVGDQVFIILQMQPGPLKASRISRN